MAQKEELMITGKKTIIALVAVVLVLCAGIYFALTFNKTDDETENTGESNIVTAFEKDVSLLESVEITNENGTFTLEKSGDEYIEMCIRDRNSSVIRPLRQADLRSELKGLSSQWRNRA